MATMKLLRTHKLKLLRSTGEGYLDDNEDFIEQPREEIDILCSIQPYRRGSQAIVLPFGVETSDIKRVWSVSEMKAYNEHTKMEGDAVEIKGVLYEAFDVEEWIGYKLTPDHYKAHFIRSNLLTTLKGATV